jgi:pseudouridine synthase
MCEDSSWRCHMVRLDHVAQAWLRSSGAPRTSLKEAQRRVRAGEFSIGGEVTYEPKQQLIPGIASEAVSLTVGGESVSCGSHTFLLMNKPVGYVCQRHPVEPTVYNLIPPALRRDDLVCVGRLDRDTTGTLLFGTDGGLQSMLLFPTSRLWKRYTAELDPSTVPLRADAVEAFEAGLVLDDDGTRCASAKLELSRSTPCELGGPSTTVHVSLHEGFFHQVKRMLKQVGGLVTALHRDTFGSLDASGLAPGEMRPLTLAELEALAEMMPVDRVAQRENNEWERQSQPAPKRQRSEGT